MLPPTEPALSGIDLDAVPLPRIEEISERGTFTRPMPEQAAVLGQRGRPDLRPHCRDAVGGAVPAGPHAAADTYPLAHPRADHPDLPAAGQSRRPAGTCTISAAVCVLPESGADYWARRCHGPFGVTGCRLAAVTLRGNVRSARAAAGQSAGAEVVVETLIFPGGYRDQAG